MAYRTRTRRSASSFFAGMSLTNSIIFVNVAVFLIYWIAAVFSNSLWSYIFLTPSLLFSGYFWTLITSMFLHVWVFHLFVNMFSLFFLGNFLERIIGRKRFFWVYIISGAIGGLFFAAFTYIGLYIPRGDFLFGIPSASAIGASGALFGLVGVLALLVPYKKVYFLAGPLLLIILQFVFINVLPVPLQTPVSVAITVLLFLMIFSIFSTNRMLRSLALPLQLSFWAVPIVAIIPLFIIGFFVDLPIGNTAHLGGLVVGLVYGAYLRMKYARKVALLNRLI